ncbi:MAG TPA: lipid-A-disaccharide synthase N-terminal domain-containing protein [Novimethylophilus sp.]|jgi:lipid-A-disaccharide synthase-like uncharacterized protein|uniref:lipid-A-disaccharide synthase N-terminal domain-containing protein n=1 Tax=Novimethylophilus sp. TaxID=2137426 RepID=UPI002F413D18
MDIHTVPFLWHLADKVQVYFYDMSLGDKVWLAVGMIGQLMFTLRFVVQWIHSERHQKSVIPVSFWYYSLIGGITVLAYGFHKLEPVIILGQLPGTIVYSRNLILIYREKRDVLAEVTEEEVK